MLCYNSAGIGGGGGGGSGGGGGGGSQIPLVRLEYPKEVGADALAVRYLCVVLVMLCSELMRVLMRCSTVVPVMVVVHCSNDGEGRWYRRWYRFSWSRGLRWWCSRCRCCCWCCCLCCPTKKMYSRHVVRLRFGLFCKNKVFFHMILNFGKMTVSHFSCLSSSIYMLGLSMHRFIPLTNDDLAPTSSLQRQSVAQTVTHPHIG